MLKSIWYHCEYSIVRTIGIFIENLPIQVAYGLASFIGTLAFLLASRRRRQVYTNLQIAYPKGIPFAITPFTQKVFIHFFTAFVELIITKRLFFRHTWQQYLTGPGIEAVDKDLKPALKSTKGVVFVAAHLGGFTLLGHISSYFDCPMLNVIRALYNPLLNQYFVNLLSWSGHRVVFKEEAYEFFKKALPQGMSPATFIDQHAGRKALYVEFMGQKAYTAASAAALARQFQVPIFLPVLFRKGLYHFEFHLPKVPIPELSSDKQADLENITRNINQILEDYIRMHPEQWCWLHRRWR